MGIFASRITKTIDIPGDPGQTVTIQKLAGRHIHKARQENLFASIDNLRRMGGRKFQEELLAAGGEDTPEKAAARAKVDPLNSYDRAIVLHAGVKAWTCVDEAGQPIAVTPSALDDLDEETSAWLAREILELSVPAAFQTEAEREDAQVKG